MKDITPYLMNLNEQLEDKKFLAQHPTLFDLMAKCLVYLLDMLLRQFKAFFDYHNMKSTGPLNCAMGVFMLMQNFVALMEDRVDNKHKPWQMHTSAKDLPFLLANKLCVSDKLVKSYTHDEMTMALFTFWASSGWALTGGAMPSWSNTCWACCTACACCASVSTRPSTTLPQELTGPHETRERSKTKFTASTCCAPCVHAAVQDALHCAVYCKRRQGDGADGQGRRNLAPSRASAHIQHRPCQDSDQDARGQGRESTPPCPRS